MVLANQDLVPTRRQSLVGQLDDDTRLYLSFSIAKRMYICGWCKQEIVLGSENVLMMKVRFSPRTDKLPYRRNIKKVKSDNRVIDWWHCHKGCAQKVAARKGATLRLCSTYESSVFKSRVGNRVHRRGRRRR